MSKSSYSPISGHLDDVEAAQTEGRRKMEWALQHMPILQSLREEFESNSPLAGETVGMAMHVEAKTANLVELLALGGAEVAITGCNPLSTHDDVSAPSMPTRTSPRTRSAASTTTNTTRLSTLCSTTSRRSRSTTGWI